VRGAQLLAGRPRTETRMLLQTRVPEHEVVRAAVAGQPEIVTEGEIARRRVLGYPPFGALAELSGDDAALQVAAGELQSLGVRAYGPSDGRLLVQTTDSDALADALHRVLPGVRAGGRVRVAVDPPRV